MLRDRVLGGFQDRRFRPLSHLSLRQHNRKAAAHEYLAESIF